MTDIHVRPRNM